MRPFPEIPFLVCHPACSTLRAIFLSSLRTFFRRHPCVPAPPPNQRAASPWTAMHQAAAVAAAAAAAAVAAAAPALDLALCHSMLHRLTHYPPFAKSATRFGLPHGHLGHLYAR